MCVPRVKSVKTLVQKCSAEMVLSRYLVRVKRVKVRVRVRRVRVRVRVGVEVLSRHHEGRAEMIRLYTGSEPSQNAPSRPKCT